MLSTMSQFHAGVFDANGPLRDLYNLKGLGVMFESALKNGPSPLRYLPNCFVEDNSPTGILICLSVSPIENIDFSKTAP